MRCKAVDRHNIEYDGRKRVQGGATKISDFRFPSPRPSVHGAGR